MKHVLKYGNINSSDFDVYVLDVSNEEGAERDIETVSIVGKNGDIHFDNGRFLNKEVTYKCYVRGHADIKLANFMSALLSVRGYQRIEDTMHPEYYKMGELTGSIEPVFSKYKTGARFDLTMNCKPQKWLMSGENEVVLGSSNFMYNPTLYGAFPVMNISGAGDIGINSETVTIASHTGAMVLDFEFGDAYSQTDHSNYNQYVSVTGNDFPVLKPGNNNITLGGTLQATIIPRWWTV